MLQPTTTFIRTLPRTLTQHRPFSTRPALHLWNGTTQPVDNKHFAPTIQSSQELSSTLSGKGKNASPTTLHPDAEKVRRTHTKFIEDLLSRATSSDGNAFDKKSKSTSRRPRKGQHSLSEPALFRTDGPLTPYPIELDTGEKLEPKHATLVRIFDKGGEARSIVVAEVDDDAGKQRSILLALDMEEYREDKGAAVGRRISAEEMYATLGLERSG
ncbi:hypothetical protein EJ08DRAFT_648985 [Tothia fuscella]|uniref:Uncharacterized protein n=1 Tax=Tothia fuscella TaxID=1048955 RepID=A0A9P4NTH5_9PEZI|nr:hypothetical protein EJ08DRAFT_648985 [Tothia fuscella]